VRTLAEVVVFVAGALVVLGTLLSAVRTVVLPRAASVRLTRIVFVNVRRVFEWWANRCRTYERQDAVLAHFAPVALLCLPVVWLSIVLLAGTAMFWGLGQHPLDAAFVTSGSSLLTLGFATASDVGHAAVAFLEGMVGLVLLALLISYLPTMYASFSRREAQVALLAVRAGSPPTGVDLVQRLWTIGLTDGLDDLWTGWEQWFAELDETHTSAPSLVFFRSPRPERSWITAAGAVLDGASLFLSSVRVDDPLPEAALCIRSGYLALRNIAGFFSIPYDADPRYGDPVSIDRSEFDVAYERLAAVGLPMKPDREQAWHDFAGWRVNYDQPLLGLAGLIHAPTAPWSSDRSTRTRYAVAWRRRSSASDRRDPG
jgi:hypothetical protein